MLTHTPSKWQHNSLQLRFLSLKANSEVAFGISPKLLRKYELSAMPGWCITGICVTKELFDCCFQMISTAMDSGTDAAVEKAKEIEESQEVSQTGLTWETPSVPCELVTNYLWLMGLCIDVSCRYTDIPNSICPGDHWVSLDAEHCSWSWKYIKGPAKADWCYVWYRYLRTIVILFQGGSAATSPTTGPKAGPSSGADVDPEESEEGAPEKGSVHRVSIVLV